MQNATPPPIRPTAPRIHLVENIGYISPIENGEWESGYWVVSEETAEALIGGQIFFHANHVKPSHFGGVILGFRLAEEPDYYGRKIFRFRSSSAFKNVKAGKDGWGNEKKIVL